MATSSNSGTAGDKGPEGEQGPPGHMPMYELGKPEPCWIPIRGCCDPYVNWSGTPLEGRREKTMTEPKSTTGISLQDIISSRKVAATEAGAVVLMPQEFDADSLQAYIHQAVNEGIKDHETALLRKVSDTVSEILVEGGKLHKTNHDKLTYQVRTLKDLINSNRTKDVEADKQRALDLAELHLKIEELEGRLDEKTRETKLLRTKLHAANAKKRFVKRRNYSGESGSTPKPGAGGSEGG